MHAMNILQKCDQSSWTAHSRHFIVVINTINAKKPNSTQHIHRMVSLLLP